MRSFLAIGLMLALTGCSSLVIRADDSGLQKVGKVTVRSVNCLLTILVGCASEWAAMKDVKQNEELLARYPEWRGTALNIYTPAAHAATDQVVCESKEPGSR